MSVYWVPISFHISLTIHTFAERRFRLSNGPSTRAPAPAPPSETSSDMEKTSSEAHIETRGVYQEDEQFEWREVFRGLTEIQVWLTALGYLGLIVSLYSYSLFL